MTDVERFLDSDEGARNDALVITEKRACQQNDRNDAGGADEGKLVRNDTQTFAWRIADGTGCCAAPLSISHAPVLPLPPSPHPLAEKTLKEIDRRSNAYHKRIAICRGRISAWTDHVLRVEF